MAFIDELVSITITRDTRTPSQAGFGTPLIAAYHALYADRVRSYGDLAEMLTDGFTATDPAYLAASAVFAQDPAPPTVKIGRRALAMTQVIELTPSTPAASEVFSVTIDGALATCTADASPTVAEICTALASAINALSLGVTAVGSSGTKVVCTAAAGVLHSYARTSGANLALHDATTNPGVATDLAAILAADGDWYGLLLDSNSPAEVSAAAGWVETAKKVFGYQTSDTAHLASGSTTVLAYTLKTAGYTRTDGIYHPELGTATAWAAAAWKARQFVGAPGSATAAFKSLAGVSSYDLTTAQRAALESYNLNFYTTAGALALTFPGKTASGEWIDVVRDLDWMRSRLQEGIFGVLVANAKVPFTDEGIGLVAASVRAVLTAAVAAGVLASFSLTVPRASAVSTANKTARNLPGVTFTGVLAGAIHTTAVTGRVSA